MRIRDMNGAVRRSGRFLRGSVALIMVTLVAGCGGDDMDDLRQYVEQVKSSHKGRIEPMPEARPFQGLSYQAADLRDPFVPAFVDPMRRMTSARGAKVPDANRRREPLESYPLDSLKLMGTLQRGGTIQAVIKAGDGAMYTAGAGNRLGQNHGRIVRITDNRIEIRELVSDGMGGWEQRSNTMSLNE